MTAAAELSARTVLDELVTRRAEDGGRDCAPTAAVKHPAPSSKQESRPAKGRSDTPDTPANQAVSSQMGAQRRDTSGGRGDQSPTAAPARATDRPEQATPRRVSQVVAPVGKPAIITTSARIPARQRRRARTVAPTRAAT